MVEYEDILQSAVEQVKEEEFRPHVIIQSNDDAVTKDFEFARKAFKKRGVRVTLNLHDPFPSMGSISVLGKTIVLNDVNALRKLCESASNIDIYPRTDGKVQIDFTYHGLTK